MKHLIALMRPAQWLKNVFIMLPLFFSRNIMSADGLINAAYTFVAFSLAASSIYCFNDIMDVEADKLHPKKSKRPIASGKITLPQAYAAMFVLIVAAILSLFALPNGSARTGTVAIVVIYYVMNIAYCFGLKHIAIIDTFIISTGFVIRVLAGGISTGTWVSQWIILMTFLLALFLAFAKRRDDVVIFNNCGKKMRRNITRYNLEFLNNAISIIAAMTMICYIMWTMSQAVIERLGTEQLYITSIFVLLGMMRYMQLTIVDAKSGSPTKILQRDKFIHLCILGWIVSFIVIIYM